MRVNYIGMFTFVELLVCIYIAHTAVNSLSTIRNSLKVQLSDLGEFLMKLQEARQNHQDEVTPNPN